MRKLFAIILLLVSLVGSPVAGSATKRTAAPILVQKDRQEETVYITRTGKKYHREWCRYLAQSKIPIKRRDAISRGYQACKVCKP